MPRPKRPQIGLTMGDPAGVGPELVVLALTSPAVREFCDLVVFGNEGILQLQAQKLGVDLCHLPSRPLDKYAATPRPLAMSPEEGQHCLVDVADFDLAEFTPGKLSAACGDASFSFIQAAIDAALRGTIDAVTTCPINKAALHLAGHDYPGHTEMFAERCPRESAPERWCMMQYSEELTCTFATVHVGYSDVPQLLSKQRILDTICLTAEAIKRIEGRDAKIAVCGLNPHAGEGGLFGRHEEQDLIIPAIEAARDQGIDVKGPLPADTAFLPWERKSTDAFVCMYHDQGHIPIKALAFDRAVNTSLGLRVVRTSVDHGTAFDIAWQQGDRRPNPGSLFHALHLASKLAVEA